MTQLKYIALLFILTLLIGCATTPDWMASPSRIELKNPISDSEKELFDELKELKTLCRKAAPTKCSDNLKFIGHAAGSYRYFPMYKDKNNNMRGNSKGWFAQNIVQAEPVAELIEAAFSITQISAVEIDIQVFPKTTKNDSFSFVMHDNPEDKENGWADFPIDYNAHAYNYALNNTTVSVLEHFVKNNFHHKGRHLFLEIKATKDCMLPKSNKEKCSTPVNIITQEIEGILEDNKTDKNWLTIISFSAHTLTTAQEKIKGLANYALIAGFDDDWKESTAQKKGAVPQFTKPFQDFVKTEKWVDSLWYSPNGIGNPQENFKSILEDRPELKLSSSTYDVFFDCSLEKSFKSIEGMKGGEITSLMIDIDAPHTETP